MFCDAASWNVFLLVMEVALIALLQVIIASNETSFVEFPYEYEYIFLETK